MTGRRAFLGAAGAIGAAAWLPARASFPSRAIRLVVGQAPGGQTDGLARAVAQRWSERWRDGVVVDNASGASGTIAARTVARAAPDGHTLLVGSSASLVLAPAVDDVGYDPLRDFAPIGRLARVSYALVVRSGLGARTLADVVALARQRPGTLTVATVGRGSNVAVLASRFARAAGVELVPVPYRGGAPSVQALLAGEVDATICDLSAVAALAATGRLHVLAVVGEKRSPLAPEAPTLREAGYAGVGDDPWYGLVGPAGMPGPVLEALAAMVRATVQDPAFGRRFASLGYTAFDDTPEGFARDLAAEVAHARSLAAAGALR